MSNTVEFILRLKDLMSGTMAKATSTAQRGLNTTTRSVATLERQMRMIERKRDIAIDTRQIRQANREIGQLQNRINSLTGNSSSGSSMFKSVVGGNLAASGIQAAGGGLMSVINTGLEAQQQKAALKVMAGESGGEKLYNDLNKFAQDSIFGNEVFKNAQTMKAFGMETDKVMPTLKMLGDISMGDKEKLGALTLAFSQIKSAGRLMGQDLLQLVNAGFNPLQIISQKTGIGMADLKKKMEDGQIPFKMVEQAFISATSRGGAFYDMTNKIAQTDYGKLQAASGQLQGLALRIGGILAPAIGNFITNYGVPFINFLDSTVSWVQRNKEWLTPLVIGVGALAVGYNLMAIKTMAWAKAQAILDAIMMLTPINLIIGAVVALAALIGYLIYKVNGWGEAWKHTVEGAKLLFKAFVGTAKWEFDTMINGLMIGLNTIQKGWYEFKNAVGLGDSAANNNMIAQINANTELRKKSIVDGAKKVTSLYAQSGAEFMAAGKSLTWGKGSLSQSVAGIKNSLLGGGAATPNGNADFSALSTPNSVTAGGAKQITININKEMFGSLSINSMNIREGVSEMETMIKEAVYRVFYSLETSQ